MYESYKLYRLIYNLKIRRMLQMKSNTVLNLGYKYFSSHTIQEMMFYKCVKVDLKNSTLQKFKVVRNF